MKIILFTSDISGLDLPIPSRNLTVVLPCNRLNTEKIWAVATWCKAHNIPLTYQLKKNSASYLEMEGLDPYEGIEGELGVSWMYTMLFPHEILRRFPIKNFHAGLPGPHALKKAIERRDKTIKCFWHWVDAGIDTGPVIAERTIDLDQDFDRARADMIKTGIEIFK